MYLLYLGISLSFMSYLICLFVFITFKKIFVGGHAGGICDRFDVGRGANAASAIVAHYAFNGLRYLAQCEPCLCTRT